MQVGDIISGFKTDEVITLHVINSAGGETVSIEVQQYAPESEQYDWAVAQLASLGET